MATAITFYGQGSDATSYKIEWTPTRCGISVLFHVWRFPRLAKVSYTVWIGNLIWIKIECQIFDICPMHPAEPMQLGFQTLLLIHLLSLQTGEGIDVLYRKL